MILVVSDRRDLHARTVMRELAQLGAEPVLLDLASFPERAGLTIAEGDAAPGAEIEIPDHGRISVSSVEAIWWRRPGLFLPAPPVKDPVHRQFVYRECSEAFAGLWASLSVRWVNHPQRDEAASHKVLQLAIARRVGLALPPTRVTNEPGAARAFLEARRDRRVIFKSLSAETGTWRPTRFVTNAWVEQLDLVKHAPVIFQEYVPGVDVRVTVVGDQLFPIEIDVRDTTSPEDFRPVWREAPIASCTLPEDVDRKLRVLVAELGLRYAAIDLRRRDDGEHVFLEVNPSGQWIFLEQRTRQPITEAVARLLASG